MGDWEYMYVLLNLSAIENGLHTLSIKRSIRSMLSLQTVRNVFNIIHLLSLIFFSGIVICIFNVDIHYIIIADIINKIYIEPVQYYMIMLKNCNYYNVCVRHNPFILSVRFRSTIVDNSFSAATNVFHNNCTCHLSLAVVNSYYKIVKYSIIIYFKFDIKIQYMQMYYKIYMQYLVSNVHCKQQGCAQDASHRSPPTAVERQHNHQVNESRSKIQM